MAMTTCSRCPNPAPVPSSIEEDPLCIRHQPIMLPTCNGYRVLDCGNKIEAGGDYCPDCTAARLRIESPRWA